MCKVLLFILAEVVVLTGNVSAFSDGSIAASKENKTVRLVDSPMTTDIMEIEKVLAPKPLFTAIDKVEKNYPAPWNPSKKQGFTRVLTTLFNVHTKEAMPILEKRPISVDVLDFLFRCRGFGTVQRLDAKLLETAIAAAVHFQSPRIEIISAYRSPKFNDALAKKGRNVAGESKHTQGHALDFRLSTAEAVEVSKWLIANYEGGVGTYSENNFVHIDTGAKRKWRGR